MAFIDDIKRIPIEDYAGRLGFHVARIGRYLTMKEHDSVMIDTQRNCFWRNSQFQQGERGAAGSVIDFAIHFGGAKDVSAALSQLSKLYGIDGKDGAVKFAPWAAEPPRERGALEQRERADNHKVVMAYLCQKRGVDPMVVRYFLKHNLLYQDKRGNCVFATKDFGCYRATREFLASGERYENQKGDLKNCNYEKGYFVECAKGAKTLVVSEGVIDTMSYITKTIVQGGRFTDSNYLALCGTPKLSALENVLREQAGVTRVVIALDSDEAGRAATEAAKKIVANVAAQGEGGGFRGIEVVVDFPTKGKDWNDEILVDAMERIAKEKPSLCEYKARIQDKKDTAAEPPKPAAARRAEKAER
jgi:hypothetical protein